MHERRGAGRRSYVTELENTQVMVAWFAGNITTDQATEFIGCTETQLVELREQTIESGMELAR